MAALQIDIPTFLSFNFRHPVIDVRSEGEFEHAHIPGAVSLPLFNNEERKMAGTIYKQQGKQQAIKAGLTMVGGRLVEMVETVERIAGKDVEETGTKTVVLHCWRGGMRSGAVAWLLDMYGFRVYTLKGGYKAFRKWSLAQFEKDYPLKIIGGFTGSGKTPVLHELEKQKAIVIDLERLAGHKGSAFGNIGLPPQPSQEMFENSLALALYNAALTSAAYTTDEAGENAIWLEDESQRIGQVNIPNGFFNLMRKKPLYFLEVPAAERLNQVVAEYGRGDKEDLARAIARIEKRLGGLETKNALGYLNENKLAECAAILLQYYDKLYLKSLQKRELSNGMILKIACKTTGVAENAAVVMQHKLIKENA